MKNWRDYVPFWNPDSPMPIREISHQHYAVTTRRGALQSKSMLSSLELAYLYYATRNRIRGHDAIVDLGPYCGVGTVAMASGIVDNASATGLIYSYDLFLTEGYDWFFDAGKLPPLGSVFPIFLRLTEDHRHRIVPVPGDALRLRWSGKAIALLFVDIAKSWPLNNWVVTQMFPCLHPGSILIQQDLVHYYEWWLQVVMEHYADRFQFEEVIYGASAVYTCMAPVSAREAVCDLSQLSLARKIELMERAAERMPASAREVLKCARVKCFLDHGSRQEAEALLGTVETARLTDDPALDFSEIAASNLAALELELKRST